MEAFQAEFRAVGIAHPDCAPIVEPGNDLGTIDVLEVFVKGLPDGGPDQVSRDVCRAPLLALVLELDFSGDRRQRGIDIAYPGDDPGFPGRESASFRV